MRADCMIPRVPQRMMATQLDFQHCSQTHMFASVMFRMKQTRAESVGRGRVQNGIPRWNSRFWAGQTPVLLFESVAVAREASAPRNFVERLMVAKHACARQVALLTISEERVAK